MPSKVTVESRTAVPSESCDDSKTMTSNVRKGIFFTSLAATIMSIDCLARTSCIFLPDFVSISDLHIGLVCVGAAAIGWKMLSIESSVIYAFLYNMFYHFITTSSRYILVIYDSDPRPTGLKRFILSLIILLEVVLFHCISHKYGWTNMTEEVFSYYAGVSFMFYGNIYYVYDNNLGLGILLGSLFCEVIVLALIQQRMQ